MWPWLLFCKASFQSCPLEDRLVSVSARLLDAPPVGYNFLLFFVTEKLVTGEAGFCKFLSGGDGSKRKITGLEVAVT